MDTVIGQKKLMEEFGKGAFSFIIVEDMPEKDVAKLTEKIKAVDHVETVLWYNSIADMSIPMEIIPEELYSEFNRENSTMMAVFFDSATSVDDTMNAIREIRSIAGKQCFVSGMSALVTDLKDLCEKEEPIYVGIAVVLALLAMMLFLDGWLVPFVFLASIGIMVVINLGTNYFLGEISYITKALSAVLQLAVKIAEQNRLVGEQFLRVLAVALGHALDKLHCRFFYGLVFFDFRSHGEFLLKNCIMILYKASCLIY